MDFLGSNFLLSSETGRKLFHDFSAALPIIDYHCHLSPQEIADDKRFSSITEVLLGGDHYKWRAMRSAGVTEKYITGGASERDRFRYWAKILPWCIGNPLYHWTHLELQRYFGVNKILNERTEEEIWNVCNEQIQKDDFSAKGLIRRSNVEVICTTDDPCDDLRWHDQISKDLDFNTKVLPTFRPDKVIGIDADTFVPYIKKLSEVSGVDIKDWESLQNAISTRVEFFHNKGCRVSDHGLQYIPLPSKKNINIDHVLSKVCNGQDLEDDEINEYQVQLLIFFAKLYEKKDWTMQLHIGTLRNVNKSALIHLGPDTGFDVISDHSNAQGLACLLGEIEYQSGLPKTILYNLNPTDNFVFAVMTGAFQANAKIDMGKMQFGAGWWYNDQKDGIVRHLCDLGNLGVLGKFVGMLTDSRSFLSYSRHEYFRRIFCNLVGTWVDDGEYPNDESMLKKIIEGVSYYNAKAFLNFK